jgi:hypothetical protein
MNEKFEFVLIHGDSREMFARTKEGEPQNTTNESDALKFASIDQAEKVRDAFELSSAYVGGRPNDR